VGRNAQDEARRGPRGGSSAPGGLVAVATDESAGATVAVEWAASFARSIGAELLAIRVVVPLADAAPGTDPGANGPAPAATGTPTGDRAEAQAADEASARERAAMREALESRLPGDGLRARAVVEASEDIAAAILAAAERAGADVVVVGSSGMRGRKQFLLGNVANRVTHLASTTVVVVNTATGEASTEEPSESDTLTARAREIARVLGPVGVRQLSGRLLRFEGDPDAPRRLREALEHLGPTFGKLGQILSTRPDLISEEYVTELSALQSDVPPMSEAEVVGMMERELGVPWEDVFSSIEPEPLAAGTIGQVHRARMADGHRVVVKVQRPEAEAVVERDLELLDLIVRPASRSSRLRRVIDLPSLAEQVASALRAELDFGEEARNIVRMGEIVAPYDRIGVPACHRELSTSRLLVIDEVVGGVPLLEAPEGPERTEAARQLMQAYYKQVLEEGFFHADPHPGNMLWADGAIWLLDLGMVGRLDARARRQLFLILLAFAQGDVELLADVSIDLSGIEDETRVDMDEYRREIGEVVSELRGRSLEEIQMVELLNRLTMISVRRGVPLPPAFVMVGKALAQVDGTVSELAPELDPIAEARRFFVRSVSRRLAGRLDPQQVIYEVERLRYRAGQISEGLATVVGSRPGRQLEVRFTSQRLEEKVMRASRAVALGLSAGLTWVAATQASTSDQIDPRLSRALRGAAGGLSVWFAAEVLRSR
jgi:predicted unusual protein kinase regulating ubiquinone biosynthesis (AarF/ABC1/UbiB family)/nucleotide-binding universal stress UspA family protein